jgi:hypothetical protein
MSLLFHVFETWSLILREEHDSEVPETKILRNASESKRGKARGGWINFQNEQSGDLYARSNIIRMTKTVRLADHAAGNTAKTATYTVFVEEI